LNEARERRDLVVKGTSRRIALLCMPVDSARSRGLGACADTFYQGPAYTPTARSFHREHVLEIANGANLRGRAVEKIMDEPDQRLALFSNQRMHRLKAVEKKRCQVTSVTSSGTLRKV
jgi:hypothetical protein